MPLASIEGVALLSREEVEQSLTGRLKSYEYAGQVYEVAYLGALLGLGIPESLPAEARFPLLLIRAAGRRVGVHVDAMLGRREIVVKTGRAADHRRAGHFRGDHPRRRARRADSRHRRPDRRGPAPRSTLQPERTTLPFEKTEQPVTVMVVDDSITIRKVTARILERHNLRVITAKNGLDAVRQLQDVKPDLFLMDIEMPQMDGFELASHVRADARLRDVPIIMITSRTGEKHRERAMRIGVDRYLGKPFQEAELMREINALLGERKRA
ncbi:MAG: hypothetical protein KatS3mg121_0736 [Gammaproteobacteria bacterium]|nr:MAG: hypothetical protein KatS3mg121_0736 [Gammaproteobacteria bacterium]